MSRIILECHESGAASFVVGWDAPLSTYFWQSMGDGDMAGQQFDGKGQQLGELPSIAQLFNSMPPKQAQQHKSSYLIKLLKAHADDPDSGMKPPIDLTKPKSWTNEVQADRSGSWAGNALYWATKEECELYGRDLEMRWIAVHAYRAVPTDMEPNYAWDEKSNPRYAKIAS